jgi:hypothetical protein
VDPDDFLKMQQCIPLLHPEESYADMLLVPPYKVAQVFFLRVGHDVHYFSLLLLIVLYSKVPHLEYLATWLDWPSLFEKVFERSNQST